MPKDIRGVELEVGQKVNIPCRVTTISGSTISVKTIETGTLGSDSPTTITLIGSQMVTTGYN